MSFSFTGNVAVVTGASSGVGAATARLLAASGAKVVLVGRDKERLAATEAQVAASGAETRSLVVDLTADGAPEEVARSAVEAFGAVDVLAHCAAILEMAPLADAPVESIDRMWRVNLRAPMLLTKAVIPHLADGSAIVFVSSTVAHTAFPGYAPYSATKGAVEAVARSLAVELAPRTRVNVVAPGFIVTPMLTDQYPGAPGLEAWVIERTPLGFICSAEDVAQNIRMLSCPETSRYITGTTLVADGGWVARG